MSAHLHSGWQALAGARRGGTLGRVLRTLLALWLLALGLALALLVMLAVGVGWLVSRLLGGRRPLPRPVFVARGWRGGHPRGAAAGASQAQAAGAGEVVDVEVREIPSR